jgi:hypothetical protein
MPLKHLLKVQFGTQMSISHCRLAIPCLLPLLLVFAYSMPQQKKDDAGTLLKRVVANLKANDLKSQGYTFTEDYHNINYDKKLKIRTDDTAKYETVFVEGTPYKRKVEENGKSLSGKGAEEEEQKYQATVAERRRMNAELKQTPFQREYRLPSIYEEWPNLFVATIRGEEMLDGRSVLKMVLTPRSSIQPESNAQKDALQTSIQLWIDKADEHPVHIKREYLRDGVYLLRGGTIELFWQKDPQNGTYLLTQALTHYRVKYLWETVTGETDQQFSNYKRFGVDVKVTPEPSEP